MYGIFGVMCSSEDRLRLGGILIADAANVRICGRFRYGEKFTLAAERLALRSQMFAGMCRL